jgi:class 3 adenylate cyclase
MPADAGADSSPNDPDLQRRVDELAAELREALSREAAVAEILQVTNETGGDLAKVFATMIAKAAELCAAPLGHIWTYDGGRTHPAAVHGDPGFTEWLMRQGSIKPGGPETPLGRVLLTKQPVQIVDAREDEGYRGNHPVYRELVDRARIRSILVVPMRKGDALLGAISVYRRERQAFTDQQIRLLASFAEQAVIAMENARLFTELREALEQQTATTEVMQAINSSPGNLKPVLDAMLDRAVRLTESAFGIMNLYEEEGGHRVVALHGVPDSVIERWSAAPQSGPEDTTARFVGGEDVVQIEDLKLYVSDRQGAHRSRALVEISGARSFLAVALRKDGKLLGSLTTYRQEVRPFTDKQVALLQNFAAQAVIAMENARLLNQLRERNEEIAGWNRDLEARVAKQVEELGRVGRLKRFLAPQLAEMIVSQGDEKILESHRREIVVVFCDLRGYTAFTETAEPEEVLDFLREYHGALGPLIGQFEGTLDQFSGDGIMVFFNDPVPIPDPAERAVKMAVAMREAASSLIAGWRERGRELGFGVGIAQGYATLGQIGFSERSGYTAIGTVCNVAARLCGEAKDGQILLGQRVNVALKGSVATEQVGALVLKGLSQPVVAYNVPVTASQPALRVIDGGNH